MVEMTADNTALEPAGVRPARRSTFFIWMSSILLGVVLFGFAPSF